MTMEVLIEKILSIEDKQEVFDLWNDEYPVNLGFQTIQDMDNYLNTLQDLTYYLLINDTKQIKGWAMTYSAGTEKWFAITISKDVQRQGKGAFLLNILKSNNKQLNGWVIDHEKDYKRNGEVYQSPLSFYKKNGFKIFSEYRLELPVLSAVKINWYKDVAGIK